MREAEGVCEDEGVREDDAVLEVVWEGVKEGVAQVADV
jgi:hypothetical protein